MSPRLPVDFSEAEDFGPVPLEDNPFYCEVTDISDHRESDKGTLYVSAEFTVVDGEHEGRKFWRNLPITGPGAGFYEDFVKKVMHDPSLEREEIIEIPTEDLIGRDVDVMVEHEDYQGQTRNRVNALMIPE